jgi:hypothetical protein
VLEVSKAGEEVWTYGTEETTGVAEVEASGVSTGVAELTMGVAELTMGVAELTTGTAELDPAGGWAPYPPLLEP